MAGTVGFLTLAAAGPDASPPSPAAAEQWEVSFSRFFPYPPRRSTPVVNLRPLPSCKIRSTGTWIAAYHAALLAVVRPRGGFILSVSVRGKIYEEHFVSNLHFSWPQVTCVPECPVRGSRVVIASYRDGSNQIQKFAVRFLTSSAAGAFIRYVEDCSRETMEIGPPGSDFMCENSSPSEYVASNGLNNRPDEESSYEEPTATVALEMPALTFNNDDSERPPQPLLASNVENIFSGFPPSFTDMLNNCIDDSSKDATAEQKQTKTSEYTQVTSQDGESLPPHDQDAPQQQTFMDESRLKSQIAKYISDASFHEMLSKIESVIDELGGDLAL